MKTLPIVAVIAALACAGLAHADWYIYMNPEFAKRLEKTGQYPGGIPTRYGPYATRGEAEAALKFRDNPQYSEVRDQWYIQGFDRPSGTSGSGSGGARARERSRRGDAAGEAEKGRAAEQQRVAEEEGKKASEAEQAKTESKVARDQLVTQLKRGTPTEVNAAGDAEKGTAAEQATPERNAARDQLVTQLKRGTPTEVNAAGEAEKGRAAEQAKPEWRVALDQLVKLLKSGTPTEEVTGPSAPTAVLPPAASGNSPSAGSNAAAREATMKALKDLKGSAYWGLKAARAALDAKDEVTTTLDDKWADARKWADFSTMASAGKSVPGTPEFTISVPEVPPPVAVNPQIKLYDYISQQARALVPAVIATQEAIEKKQAALAKAKEASAASLKGTEQLVGKLIACKNEAEKERLKAQYDEKKKKDDELLKEAEGVANDVAQLTKVSQAQRATLVRLEKL